MNTALSLALKQLRQSARGVSMNLPRFFLIAGLEAALAISIVDLSAQPPSAAPEKLFPTTSADKSFGEGGKKIIWSDDKNLINSIDLMDSEDHLRATHRFFYDSDQKTKTEGWLFYSKDDPNRPTGSYWAYRDNRGDGTHFTLMSDYIDGDSIHTFADKDHSLADYESFLEAVQKQFAKDGTFLSASNVDLLVRDKGNNATTKAALFDCLKSKFPNISGFGDTAFDIDSKREFAWREDRQAWVDAKTLESVCPPSEMDPCLVGTWECTSFNEEGNRLFAGGGTGFKVTFKSDGTETVDYSSMQPTLAGATHDKIIYAGTATARISTKDGVAKIEKKEVLGATLTLESVAVTHQFGKLPNLGPGGLGSTKDNNKYTCTEDTLEYKTSVSRDEKANCTVKLTKVKGLEAEQPSLPPNKSLVPAPDVQQPPLPPAKDVYAAPDQSKKAPGDNARAQEAAMLKALQGNPSDAQKQRAADKVPAHAKDCEALKEEIRQRQRSLTEMEKEATQWRDGSIQHSVKAESIQRDILKAQKDGDEEKRGELIEEARKEYSKADEYSAHRSKLQAQQQQVRKEIEEFMTQLADCKSKPHE